jgi:PleD family two-component response regulator
MRLASCPVPGQGAPTGRFLDPRRASRGSDVVNDIVANNLKGLKILVIDDSKTIRRTAQTLLTKEGCEVFTAVDGFDAL